MKDIVTFETAVRLKEAGFEQPTPEAGQFWYYIRFPGGTAEKNVLCVLSHEYPYQDNLEALPLDGGERVYNSRNTQVFAPTATDILRELPDKTALYRVNKDMFLCWVRKDRALMMGDGPCMVNAAEAAAEAWIEWKEQTTTI